jgi:hypothetical protein
MFEKSAKKVNFFSFKSHEKKALWADFSKKVVTIFFKFTFLEFGEDPHPIERYLEV